MANEAMNPPELAHIEADDTDEGIGYDISDPTTSSQSSLPQFEFENGRRYHSYQSGAYAFPNDEKELDRMDLENHVFLMLLGNEHFLAPLEEPHEILDLGTGTGIWAIGVADKYPGAHVVGTDLSPVQPQLVPVNLEFQVDDFEQEWSWKDDSFDLIHGRLLLASVTDYPKLFQRAFAATKPGGYFEMHDIDPESYSDDGTLADTSKAAEWGRLFKEGCGKMGRRILLVEEYRQLMEDAGFVEIKEVIMKRPHNSWPKDKLLKWIGLYTLLNHLQGVHAFTIGVFTRVLGWTSDEVEVFCALCRKEWKDRSIHGYQKVIAIYGKKPPIEATG